MHSFCSSEIAGRQGQRPSVRSRRFGTHGGAAVQCSLCSGLLRAPTQNAAEENPPAFSIYSGLGGLPQDPLFGGESSLGSQESCWRWVVKGRDLCRPTGYGLGRTVQRHGIAGESGDPRPLTVVLTAAPC